MHPIDSLEACDCLDWYIHIFKCVLRRRLWNSLLLTLKEMIFFHREFGKKLKKPIKRLPDRKKVFKTDPGPECRAIGHIRLEKTVVNRRRRFFKNMISQIRQNAICSNEVFCQKFYFLVSGKKYFYRSKYQDT